MEETPSEQPRREPIVLLAILLEGGLAVLAWLLGWSLDRPPLERVYWQMHDAALGVAASLPLLLVFALCVRWPLGPLAGIKRFSEEIIRPLFAPCTLLDLAGISLLAGLGEEMLFRAVLQGLFSDWLGLWQGLLLASVLFGLLHLVTPAYAVMATVMGAYLGYCWIETGNLLVVIIAHALYDFLALLYLVRGPVSR